MRVRRSWRKLRPGKIAVGVTAVAVLVAGLTVADRVAASRAAGRLAARLACLAGTPSTPRVRITGFPFVRQALAGRLDRVEVDADSLTRGDVTVDRVAAVVSGARLPDDGDHGQVTIDEAEVGFDLPFGRLPAQLQDRPVSYRPAPNGLLAVSTERDTALGRIPVTVFTRPTLSGDRLTLTPVEVEVLGVRRSAAGLADRLGGTSLTRDLPDLPGGLSYRSVAATQAGLHVTVVGKALSVELGGGTGGGTSACHAATAQVAE